jgi:hypothetical protein
MIKMLMTKIREFVTRGVTVGKRPIAMIGSSSSSSLQALS